MGINMTMQIAEIIKSPTKPLSAEQLRIRSLQQGVERSRQQLAAERDRQRKQRELKRLQAAQRRLS